MFQGSVRHVYITPLFRRVALQLIIFDLQQVLRGRSDLLQPLFSLARMDIMHIAARRDTLPRASRLRASRGRLRVCEVLSIYHSSFHSRRRNACFDVYSNLDVPSDTELPRRSNHSSIVEAAAAYVPDIPLLSNTKERIKQCQTCAGLS